MDAYGEGKSISEIVRLLHIDRKTVQKYIEKETTVPTLTEQHENPATVPQLPQSSIQDSVVYCPGCQKHIVFNPSEKQIVCPNCSVTLTTSSYFGFFVCSICSPCCFLTLKFEHKKPGDYIEHKYVCPKGLGIILYNDCCCPSCAKSFMAYNDIKKIVCPHCAVSSTLHEGKIIRIGTICPQSI